MRNLPKEVGHPANSRGGKANIAYACDIAFGGAISHSDAKEGKVGAHKILGLFIHHTAIAGTGVVIIAGNTRTVDANFVVVTIGGNLAIYAGAIDAEIW